MATYNGTSGDDVINATAGSNTINAGNGNNKVTAISSGNQNVTAGTGNDTITTGDGNDTINAGEGANVINAGNGTNNVTTGAGNDTITTGSGNDTINAGNGRNIIDAGDGRNSITSGTGDDDIRSGSGDDTINAGDGTNVINAGAGNNDVTAGSGNDTITTGSGNDRINAGNGNNVINAGAGNNTINAGTGDDRITALGGSDQINAGDGRNVIDAGDGNNVVNSGRGDDTIDTGSGNDTINAGDGNNLIDAGAGRNTVNTGSGADDITTGNDDDTINAGEGANVIRTGDGDNRVTSGAGADTITSGSGDDEIHAGEGNNVISAGDGRNEITTGSGNDTITTGSGNDAIYAGEGNNVVNAGNGHNAVYTGSGNDTITTGSGNDAIYAGEGSNVINAGDGINLIYSGSGNDRIITGSGSDLIYAGNGDDFVDAGGGSDVVWLDGGNDTYRYVMSQHTNTIDVAWGGSGTDTLQLVLTAEQARDARVISDLQRFNSDPDGSGLWGWVFGFQFSAFNLSIRDFEKVDIVAPVDAINDVATVGEDAQVTVNVLANDIDLGEANNNQLRVISYDATGVPGTLTLANNQFTFIPGAAYQYLAVGQSATVTFSYTIGDNEGFTDTATVTLTIVGSNDGPVAVADVAAITENAAVTVDVLANDTDADANHAFTLVSAGAPSGKGLATVVNNKLVFAPGTAFDHLAAGATETVVVSYTMKDDQGATSVSTLTVTVTGTNDGPVANADVAAGTENQALTINVLANDTDVDDGAILTLTSATAPAGKGSASVVGNQLVFNPGAAFDHLAAGVTETVVLNYAMKDEFGAVSSATVTVTITGTNDGPVAVSDTAAGTENQALTVNVLANDTDLDDGAVLTLTSATAPAGKGVATVVNNKLVFTPGTAFDHLAAGATETVVVSYALKDDKGATATSTVTLTITGTNDGPVAVADMAAETENQALTVNVLANDTDVDDGAVLTLTGASAPAGKGVASVVNNQLVFTPGTAFDHLAAGASEVVTLTYAMKDDQGSVSTATVTLTITGTNDGPVAVADAAATTENAAITVDVLANDTDLDDGHAFTLTAAAAPVGKGVASIAGNKLVFTPGSNFDHLAVGATEVVVVSYAMTDDQGAESVSTVTVTITGTNDAPVAVADIATATEDGAVVTGSVASNDSDVDDGATHSFALNAPVAGLTLGGNGSYSFDSANGAYQALAAGEQLVVVAHYTITDDQGATATSTLTITVTGTNDAPVVTSVASDAAGAVREAGANDAGTPSVAGQLASADVDHDATAIWSGSADGVYGSFAINAAGAWAYTLANARASTDALAAGETAVETFLATVTDDQGATATQLVTITLTGTNDAPIAVADTAAGTENQMLTIDVLANDTDVDHAHVLTLASATAPAGKGLAAIVNNRIVFAPGSDFDHLAAGVTEVVTLAYVMKDEFGASSASTVTVTVTGTNDAPVAGFDDVGTTENASITVDVLANDTDVDDGHVLTLTAALVSPGQGSVAIAANQLVFTPGNDFDHLAAGDTATVVVFYSIKDDKGAQSAATVTITVTGANDAPVAVADTAAGTENQVLTVDVLANDTDLDDGHSFTLSAASAPTGKGVASVLNNQLVFTPGSDFDHLATGAVEIVTVSYTMKDDQGASATSTVTVTITGTNDAPIAVADTAATAENAAITVDVLANDTDLDDGHAFTLTAATAPSGKGTVAVVDNKLVFTPGTAFDHLAAGVTEVVTIDYAMKDDQGAESVSTLTVTITGTNDGPVAVADTAAGTENQTLTIYVLANDTDLDDGHAFTLTDVGVPAGKGSATIVGNQLVFTPGAAFDHLAAGATEVVALTYAMKDDQGATSTATVTVTITGTNDAPIAVADTAATAENAAIIVDVLANDTDLDDGDAFTLTAATAPSGKGTVAVVDNKLVFTPGTAFDHLAAGVTEVVTIDYAMKDDQGAESGSTLTVTITGTNDGPVAVADTAATTENAAITVDVLANDTDLDDGHVFTLAAASAPAGKGVATIVNNQLVFTPGADFDHLAAGATESVSVTYTMRDEQGATSSATVIVTITGTNDAPVAVADVAAATEDGAIVIGSVATNDSDVDDGATRTFTLSAPVAGLTLNSDGSYSFNASNAAYQALAQGETQVVTATYIVTDDRNATATATLKITLTGTNDAPVVMSSASAAAGAVTEAGSTVTGTATATGTLTSSDVDHNATAAWSGNANGTYGSFAIDTAGHWTYTLDNSRATTDALAPGQTVTESFTALVTDDKGATAQQVITITVTGSEDNRAPVAADVALSGSSGNAGGAGVVTSPSNGTGLVFTHLIDSNGDGVADTPDSPATFSSYDGGNGIAVGDLNGDGRVDFAYASGGQVFVQTNLGDTNGSGHDSFAQSLVLSNGNYSNDVAIGDINGDGFADIVRKDYYNLTVLINNGADTNGDGLANDFTTYSITPGSYSDAYGITVADVDNDGRTDIVYSNYYGSGAATIAFNLGDTDGDGQINFLQQNLTTNTSAGMAVSVADMDGDGLLDVVVGRWDGGGVEVLFNRGMNANGTLNYVTRDVSYYGYVMETTLIDMNGDGRLDIVAANGGQAQIDISYNLGDTDGDGFADFSIQSVYTGTGSNGLAVTDLNDDGTLDILVSGTILLSNKGDANGDGQVDFDLIHLNGVQYAQDAEPLSVSTGGRGAREDGPIVKGNFSATDADAGESATLTFRIVTQPGEGTAINNNDGTFGFDPGAGFQDLAQGETRDVTFTYVAVDAHGAESAPATVTVTVAGTNDAPVVTSNSAAASGSVTEAGNLNNGATVTGTATTSGTLTSSDVDHGATATWSAATTVNGTYGTFSLDASGHWAYTLDNSRAATQALAAGATVSDHFTARVTDDRGAKADQVVNVTIHGTNDSPVAVADVSGNGGGMGATALGAPFLVNTFTQNYQSQSTVTGLSDGGFVVSYNSQGQFNGYQGVVLQRFDASGVKIGAETTVAGSYGTSAYSPTITALTNGGFAVSWVQSGNGNNQDYDNTFVQLYDAQGAAVGGVVQVNSTIVYSQYEPSISALAGGGFIVTFSDNSAYASNNSNQATDVRAQIFSSTGAKVGGEFIVNANVAGDQYRSSVTTLASGNFVVAYYDSNNGSAGGAQLFTAAGQRVGNAITLSDSSGSNNAFAVSALPNGGFVVTFQSYRYDGTQRYTDVHATIFGADGQRVGAEVVVNTNYIGDQYEPAISVLSDGSFVVVWRDNSAYYGNPDYNRGEDVRGQLVAADGTLVGADFVVGTSPQGGQYEPSITTLAGGDIVVTWTDNSGNYGDNDGGVIAQLYAFDKNDENEIVAIDVLKNDTDVDTGAAFTLVSVTQPAKGGVSIVDNKIVFDPGTAFDHLAKNVRETVTVTYVMRDENGATSSATATIIVTGTNDAPVVSGAITGTAVENGASSTLDAFANVTDVDDGTAFTAVIGTLPAGVSYSAATHSFVLNTADASLQALAPGETTTVTVSYGISDGITTTAATARWTVTGTYDAPVVTGVVSGTSTEDGAQSTLDALANAVAVDHGATLSVVNVPATLPAGVSYNSATHSFTLNPANAAYQSLAQGQTTIVSVSYNVTDGTTVIADTVRWTVTGTNDAPVVSAAVSGIATEGAAPVALSALANASDVDAGTTLSVTNIGSLPAGVTYDGAAKTFTLDPANAAFNGLKGGQTQLVTVSYSVSDGLTSVPQSAQWTVTGVNDAPAGANNTVTVLEDGALTITAANFGFSDVDGDSLLAVKIATLPAAGSLTLNGSAVASGETVLAGDIVAGKLVFTPAANANGANYANVTFQVQDNGGTTNGGVDIDQSPNTLTINVTAVNDAPSGTDTTLTVNEDTALVLSAANFGFSDATDGGANALSAVTIATLPGAGTLRLNGAAVSAGQSIAVSAINAGQLTFAAATNASGTGYASFTFKVQDNGGTANGGNDTDPTPNTLTINVNSVNDAPSGTSSTVTLLEDAAYTLKLSDFGFNDVDGNNLAGVRFATTPGGALRLNGVQLTAQQTVSAADIAAGNLIYTPGANATTNTSFTFQVQDDGGTANGGVSLSPTASTLTFAFTPVNDAPVGVDRTITATEDTALTLTAANFAFSDVESNALASVKITTVPTAGSLTLNGVAVSAGQVVSAADIVAGKLTFTAAANANGTGYATFTFQVQDNGGTANGGQDTDPSPNTMTINVTAVNDPVTDLTLSANSTPENVPSVTIGTLAAVDADTADTFTYSIRPGLDGSLFTIVGNELRVGGSGLDYEQAATRQLTVRATDAAGTFFDRVFTIQVTDSNEFTLTTANDTFNSGATNDQVLANSLTLNAGDRITTGGGADELLVFGQGTFSLSSLAAYTGVETVRLINLTTGTATLSLKAGVQNNVIASGTGNTNVTLNDLASTFTGSDGQDIVTLGTGAATVNTGNGSDTVNAFNGAATINTGSSNDTIYLGNGLATVNAGDSNDNIYVDQNGFNALQAIDGGQNFDTLYVNSARDLTDMTLTNLESLSVSGGATLTAAQAAQFSQFTGSSSGKVTIEDSAVDLTNKSITNVNFYSSNATGTVFKVSSAANALQIFGGNGNDTVQVVGAALTADQRDILFAVSSVETLIDSSGTYTAPAATPGLIRLTTGADTLPASPDSLTVNATAATLNTNDSLNAGATGTDVLAIYGTGSFNLNSYNIVGFEEIKLINNTTTQADVTLKTGQAVTFNAIGTGSTNLTLSNAAVTVNTGNGSDTINGSSGAATVSTGAGADTVFGGTGLMSVDTGADTDYVYADYNGNNGLSSFNGGLGFDYLYFYQGARDASTMTLQNFEYLYISGDTKMTAAQVAQFQNIQGGGVRLNIADANVDLTNKSVGNVVFGSLNATGTTFKVNSAAVAAQVLGGSGNDTVDASTVTLTAAQRESIFNGSLVETIIDATGTYAAPAVPAGTIKLTAGNDTLPGSPDSLTVLANAYTLTSGDSLNAGATGTDVLALYGGGVFQLATPTLLTGFEQVTLTNNGASQATVYLRAGMNASFTSNGSGGVSLITSDTAVTVTLGSGGDVVQFGAGGATVSSGAGNDTIYAANALVNVDLGNDNDTLYDFYGWNNASTFNGGQGSDQLYLSQARDLTGLTLTNFESLYLANGGTTKMNNTQFAQFTSVNGNTGSRISTADLTIDLTGKGIGASVSFVSENVTGTTFKVSGSTQAFQIVGGAGQDIVENIGTALTTDQRTALLNGASVEQLVEGNTFHGGSGANSIVGNANANTIYGNDGDDTIDGGAGADLLYGGNGNDHFVFRAGQTAGDTLFDFSGNGSAAGDRVTFYGYGTAAAGATFTQVDATHWQVKSANGALQETITVASGTTFHASDVSFVSTGSGPGESMVAAPLASRMSGVETVDLSAGEVPARHEATAAAETLSGDAGDDVFVFQAGTANGDTVLNFDGISAGGADRIEFVGFGHDAVFTQIDETHWQVSSVASGQHEVISFEPGTAINTQDFAFV